MKIRGLCCTVLALAGSPLTLADPLGFEFSTSVSSGLIDRGETLATLNNETSFTLAQPLQFGEVYGSLYRISPIGGWPAQLKWPNLFVRTGGWLEAAFMPPSPYKAA